MPTDATQFMSSLAAQRDAGIHDTKLSDIGGSPDFGMKSLSPVVKSERSPSKERVGCLL